MASVYRIRKEERPSGVRYVVGLPRCGSTAEHRGPPGGGSVPLGNSYIAERHGGRWEIDKEEAALVRRIFAMCLRGRPTRTIARQLTDERILTPEDRRAGRSRKILPRDVWNHPPLRGILTNKAYTREAAWGKRQHVTRTIRRALPKRVGNI